MDEVRRLVAFLVIALLGAAAFGLSSASSGLSVNGTTVSGNAFRSELAAINASPGMQCYLHALNPVSFGSGGGGDTMAAAGAASWANFRVEGVALTKFVTDHLKFDPTKQTLAAAKASLESEMTNAAAAEVSEDNTKPCTGTAAQAVAAMPLEMQQAQIVAQAASLYLVSKLSTTTPLTTKAMEAYFTSHSADYDTLCVSIAVVSPSRVSGFLAAQASGSSVASLAKHFSIDPSAKTGGAAGCYAPSSQDYADVRADVSTTALNTFPTKPLQIDDNGATDALFVAVTKRTVNTYQQAAAAVLSDLQSSNASSARTEEATILYESAISVDPAFGQWILNSSGPTTVVNAVPPKTDVKGAKFLTTTATNYQ
jgi:hypothetical protein